MADDCSRDHVVVHHQHATPDFTWIQTPCKFGWQTQWTLDRKYAASPHFTFHSDGATEKNCQFLSHREPKSQTGIIPCQSRFQLAEGLENRPHLIGPDAYSGVAHCDRNLDAALVAPACRSADLDLAALREFHGIPQQVPDQLPEPQGIAYHGGWQAAIEIVPQTHILRFGLEGKLRNQAGQRLAQGKFSFVQPQVIRGESGEL